LEAVLECFSFCQAKNLYWHSLDILCIVKVVITQCFLVMPLECGECDSTPVLCSTSSGCLRVSSAPEHYRGVTSWNSLPLCLVVASRLLPINRVAVSYYILFIVDPLELNFFAYTVAAEKFFQHYLCFRPSLAIFHFMWGY
jgi:hypothetical protein